MRRTGPSRCRQSAKERLDYLPSGQDERVRSPVGLRVGADVGVDILCGAVLAEARSAAESRESYGIRELDSCRWILEIVVGKSRSDESERSASGRGLESVERVLGLLLRARLWCPEPGPELAVGEAPR